MFKVGDRVRVVRGEPEVFKPYYGKEGLVLCTAAGKMYPCKVDIPLSDEKYGNTLWREEELELVE